MKTLSKLIIAVLGSSLFVGCGGYFSEQKTTNEDAPTLSSCEMKATIDDFEDSNNKIMEQEGRGGWIYSYKDGLGSEIEFPDGDFRVYPGGVGGSKYAARFRGTTAKSGGDIYAGLGFNLSATEGATYDASKYTGVTFLAKRGSTDAIGIVRLNIADVNTDPAGKICKECHNHFGTPVKLTDQWVRYVIYFDEMEQRSGWGVPRPDAIDKTSLISFAWQTVIPNIKYDFLVDDVRFIGACDESFLTPREAEAAPDASSPAPEAAPAPAEDQAASEDGETSEDAAPAEEDTESKED